MKSKRLKSTGLLIILVSVIFSSCEQEEDFEDQLLEKGVDTSIDTGVEKALSVNDDSDILAEMKALSNELYRVSTGKEPVENRSTQDFSVPPPYYAGNSGSVFINRNYIGDNDKYDNLSFGNRAPEHTTQWVSMDLTDIIRITDVGGGAQNNVGRGSVTFRLSGVGQTVTLNYRVNAAPPGGFRSVTVTPSSSANFLRNNVVPSTISLQNGSGPIKLTIHANEFGWLWLRIEYLGLIRYDQHYRFNYSSSLDNRNGGSVSMSGYNRVGISIPYSIFSAQQSYNGYCGWFKEQ